jgi:PAS domain S-box-containing protein
MTSQILVVEDEIIIAEDIQKKLKKMGYSVPAVVSSGEDAIKEVTENNPDLVLMDIIIHGEIDGIETVEKIHSFSDVPVIYLTAYADQTTLERAKITEPFGYLLKPFKERELLITIEMAIYKHKMEKKLKESEKKLRESERWLSAAIKSIGDGVIATDLKGIIKIMNPFAEALTGWKQEEASGKHLSIVFNVASSEKNKNVEDPVVKVIREGSFYGLSDKTILITKNNMEIPIDLIGTPITDEKNDIIGVVLVFYDIIERKQQEDRIKASTSSFLL